MDDIVKALRWLAKETEFVFAAEQLTTAASLIESQAAEIAELREANISAHRLISTMRNNKKAALWLRDNPIPAAPKEGE